MLCRNYLVLRMQMWAGSLGTSGCTWFLHAGFRPFDVLGTVGFWAPKQPCRPERPAPRDPDEPVVRVTSAVPFCSLASCPIVLTSALSTTETTNTQAL